MPAYDRSRLSVGIVHFGVGGFHRAHQAMYMDRLMNAGEAFDWAICGAGVMAADRAMRDALRSQDYLYTLVEKHNDGAHTPRVIGSIIDYLYAPDDPVGLIDRLADETTRIVSLTVTEGGYGISDVTGEFDPHTPEVAADIEQAALPRTVFGLITEALGRRRQQGSKPFTVVSCDNLAGNGGLARKAFTAFARLRDPELGDWIEREVHFPNSMVDRITPVTTDADREQLRDRFGIEDRWPVVCEPFVQWVLEDSFSCGRPSYERAGVQVVDDVEPYELMKLRLLNGSHQGLCYFGRLCGYEFVHEASADPLFRRFLRGYMDDEATPTLRPVPGVDLDDYKRTLIERFSNPEIRDTIARLCAESSDRIPKWVMPVVRSQLAHDGELARCAAIIASWARYAEGVDEQGAPIEVVDRQRERVMAHAARQHDEPLAFILNRELFGDLVEHDRFVAAYSWALRSLHERGARATLDAVVQAYG
ncbi:MAG: mannitol dehydrogenase family protein [Solirubrobacteraceae bacterium]|jgi:mannitol 2-dehydrogenase